MRYHRVICAFPAAFALLVSPLSARETESELPPSNLLYPPELSKAALEALAFVLAKEEREHDIHVNVVSPGLVDAGMGHDYVVRMGAGEMGDVAALVPYGRVCQPEEVASVVRFLVSKDSSYVNGQRIYVNGGGTGA